MDLLATERRHKVVLMNQLQVRRDFLYQSFVIGGFETDVRRSHRSSLSPIPTFPQTFWGRTMEARRLCFCIIVYETRAVNNSQTWSSVGVVPTWVVLLAAWGLHGEAVPYVGSGARVAGTG
jgi:hypothetical protein